MNIAVFGLGYVGCVLVGCLAKMGHRVIGVDVKEEKVTMINQGLVTLREKGLDDLIKSQWIDGQISATTDAVAAASASRVIFICVGTPAMDGGRPDTRAIFAVAGQIAQSITEDEHKTIIIRSTVPTGTCAAVAALIEASTGLKRGEDFGVVANPEFLREGTAIEDFFSPCFTLVATDCHESESTMMDIYSSDIGGLLVFTDYPTAEIIKPVFNTWHALKVAFANEVGSICKERGIDSRKVMDIFCRDTKLNLSSYYLKPGYAYGGSCLPKDLAALNRIAAISEVSTPVISSIFNSNEIHRSRLLEMISDTGKSKIAFIGGVSFKDGTDDERESPVRKVIDSLDPERYSVQILDFYAGLLISSKDIFFESEVYIVSSAEPAYLEILAEVKPGSIIIDLVGVDGSVIFKEGVIYQGICW